LPEPPGSAGTGFAGAGAGITHFDELEAIELPDGFVWRPIRRRFGIRAFGVNGYTAKSAGGMIVEEHTESSIGHEEIYIVLRGRARFTVDGNEHELGPGQLVFVRDPSLRRGAVALDDDTAVLALGGKPGEPHKISAWEAMFAAVPASQRDDWDEAIRIHEEALTEQPEHPALLFNLACMEARGGRHLDALRHLTRAIELEPKWAKAARDDTDFDSIRREPGFPS
jgi:tetratricopeptide (TPR) repeat protein